MQKLFVNKQKKKRGKFQIFEKITEFCHCLILSLLHTVQHRCLKFYKRDLHEYLAHVSNIQVLMSGQVNLMLFKLTLVSMEYPSNKNR